MLTSYPFYRTETSPRSPRSPKETQAPRRCSRACTPSQDNKGRWSQTNNRCRVRRRPRRVPATEQDSLPAGAARRRHAGGSQCGLWPVRRIPGSQIGTRPEGYWLRRVRDRGGCYQCEGGYLGNAYGRSGQADSRYFPAAVVAGGRCVTRQKLSRSVFFRRLEGSSSLMYLPYEETIIHVAFAAAIQILRRNSVRSNT